MRPTPIPPCLLCDHDEVIIRPLSCAPINEADPTQITAFYLLGCRRCRRVVSVPEDSLFLMTDRYRAKLAVELFALGFRL